jgi:hypothetical protein
VDYWTDKDVFRHFISDVIYGEARKAEEKTGERKVEHSASPVREKKVKAAVPVDIQSSRAVSYVMPYMLVLALLFVAGYVLTKSVMDATQYVCPADSKLKELTGACIFRHAGGLAALLAGITVLARLPRLTPDWLWRLIALGISGLCGFLYLLSVYDEKWVQVATFGLDVRPGVVTLSVGLLVALLASLAGRRWPSLGLKPLMVMGAVAMAVIVLRYLFPDLAIQVLHALFPNMIEPSKKRAEGPFWPIFLATASSLYLWWLAALLFDLVFIWHLYIRNAKLTQRLNEVLGPYESRKPLHEDTGETQPAIHTAS